MIYRVLRYVGAPKEVQLHLETRFLKAGESREVRYGFVVAEEVYCGEELPWFGAGDAAAQKARAEGLEGELRQANVRIAGLEEFKRTILSPSRADLYDEMQELKEQLANANAKRRETTQKNVALDLEVGKLKVALREANENASQQYRKGMEVGARVAKEEALAEAMFAHPPVLLLSDSKAGEWIPFDSAKATKGEVKAVAERVTALEKTLKKINWFVDLLR